MISCSEFMEQIGNYLEGELAAEVRSRLEAHLAHCRTCSVVYDSTRKSIQIVTDCGCFDLPDTVAKPIVAEIMAKLRSRTTVEGL